MTVELLSSAVGLQEFSEKRNVIQIIAAGPGSSSNYPAEVLRRDGAEAFPAGTQIFYDHVKYELQHPSETLLGVTTTPAVFNEESQALEAEFKYFETARGFLKDAWEHLGASIEARGFISTAPDGSEFTESIHPHPRNSIALVPRAGAEGRIVEFRESLRATINPEDSSETERPDMKPEEIEAVATAVATAVVEAQAAAKAAEVAVEPEAPKTEVADIVEALFVAGLPQAARGRVLSAIAGGADLTESIKAEQSYIADLTESLKVDDVVGVVNVSEPATAQSLIIDGWK